MWFRSFLFPLVPSILPIGTAYAIWTGIGAAGTGVLGIVLFAESDSIIKVFSLLCIVLGIIGLKGSA